MLPAWYFQEASALNYDFQSLEKPPTLVGGHLSALKNGEKIYIQVSYLLADENTREREFGAYKNVPDNYPKYVISLDNFNFSRDGIKHVNICDFLLKEEFN